MKSRASDSKGSSLGARSANTQQALSLLRQLVDLMASGMVANMEDLPELCERARETACAVGKTIQRLCENTISHQETDGLRNGSAHSKKRRAVSNKDLTYRPPVAAKISSAKTKILDITDVVLYSVQDPEDITELGDMVTHPSQASNDVVRVGHIASRITFNQQPYVPQEGRTLNFRPMPLDHNTGQAATVDEHLESAVVKVGFTSERNKAEAEQRLGFGTPLLQQTGSALIVLSTQIQIAASLDPTKEVNGVKVGIPAESVVYSSVSAINSCLTEPASLMDMILEAVRIIHQFSKYPYGVPRAVHSRILQSLGKNYPEANDVSRVNQWSDGSMWMQVLEMGSSENQRVTILNMLEYMGAWDDNQIERSLTTILTKKNKPVGRRGAAIHVLNEMQHLSADTTRLGTCLSGVRRIDLQDEGNSTHHLSSDRGLSVAKQDKRLQRKRISIQLTRGQKLSTKLIKGLGLGILFSPKI
ncbi:hypothetical protein LTR84_012800 [Exophiala bonariae]|uniref:Uncharacterized protein n=1 Tax=Exophiala bonariae TaxID=1690606 RepID=A0AAV9MRM6_9EURO|nr:hypothetical protein LTR84_012800 [Exophiala bonariae]